MKTYQRTNIVLNTPENSRKTLARLIRKYNADQIDEQKFKALVYAINYLLSYWKLEKELDIERRIEALEEAMER